MGTTIDNAPRSAQQQLKRSEASPSAPATAPTRTPATPTGSSGTSAFEADGGARRLRMQNLLGTALQTPPAAKPATKSSPTAQASGGGAAVADAVAGVQDPNAQATGWPAGVTNAQAEALTYLGITPQDLKEGTAAVPELVEAARCAKEGDVTGTLAHLAAAAKEAPGLLNKAITALTSKLPDGALKTLLQNPNLPTLVEQIAHQDWTGAAQTLASDPTLVRLASDALAKLPQVQELLGKLGLSAADLPNLGEVLPEILKLGQALTGEEVDVKAAAEAALALASKIDPGTFRKLYEKLGAHLPEGVKAFLDSIVNREDFQALAQALLNEPNLPTMIDQLSRGDWEGALKTLMDSPNLTGAAGDYLASIPAVQKLFQELGIDLTKIEHPGAVLQDLVRLGKALASNDVQEAVAAVASLGGKLDFAAFQGLYEKIAARLPIPEQIGQFFEQLFADPAAAAVVNSPVFAQAVDQLVHGHVGDALKTLAQDPAVLAAVGSKIASALGLPQGVVDALVAASGVLSNPELAGPLQDMISAIANGDTDAAMAALQALGTAVEKLASGTPEEKAQLVALMDALGHLPGGIGELFSDHELNAALVESGSAAHLINAAKKLAEGDLPGAVEELYHAAEALLTSGEKIEIAGQELPFSKEGLESFAKLFQKFFDALPNGIKNKIEQIVAKAVGSMVPILGDLITGAMDVKSFIDALKNGDGLDQLIAGGQLVLDGAGALQLTKAFTGPLKFALAALQAIRTVGDMAEIVPQFRSIFFGIGEDPDVRNDSQDRALIEGYFGSAEAVKDIEAAYPELAQDPRAFAAFVAAAQSCGIPPERFLEFVQGLVDSAKGEKYDLLDVADMLAYAREDAAARGEDPNARLRMMVGQWIDDPAAYGGAWPQDVNEAGNAEGWLPESEKAQFEEVYGDFPMGDSSNDASSFEALVALAKSLGVPPDQFVEFCQSLEQAAGTPLDQLAAGIAWHMNEEEKKYQDAFDPVAWFQGWFPTAFPSVVEQFSPPPAEEPQRQAA